MTLTVADMTKSDQILLIVSARIGHVVFDGELPSPP
jgi:hypothetical protein